MHDQSRPNKLNELLDWVAANVPPRSAREVIDDLVHVGRALAKSLSAVQGIEIELHRLNALLIELQRERELVDRQRLESFSTRFFSLIESNSVVKEIYRRQMEAELQEIVSRGE
jgi:hypothetical protein